MAAYCLADTVLCLQVFGYCIFKNGKEAKIDYPIQGFAEGTAGRSFHNGRFVQRLRRRAASQPNVTVRQGIVKRLLGSEFSSTGSCWMADEILQR